MDWLADWTNAHPTIVGVIVCAPLALMCLAVVGALIGACLVEPHRRETWDRPLPPKKERKP
jgi:hypothetical protein